MCTLMLDYPKRLLSRVDHDSEAIIAVYAIPRRVGQNQRDISPIDEFLKSISNFLRFSIELQT